MTLSPEERRELADLRQFWVNAHAAIDRWDTKCSALRAENARLRGEVANLNDAIDHIINDTGYYTEPATPERSE